MELSSRNKKMKVFAAFFCALSFFCAEAWTPTMSFAPSTIKVQRAQIERQLKAKIEQQSSLRSEIPALRASIANLDYELLMMDLATKRSTDSPSDSSGSSNTKGTSRRKDVKEWFKGLFAK